MKTFISMFFTETTGPSVHNQSFQLAPLIATFLETTCCKRLLRRHYEYGRDLNWFLRIFAQLIGGISSLDICGCILKQMSAGNRNDACDGEDYNDSKFQSPFTIERLQRIIKRHSMDPLDLMIKDMSSPEIIILIASLRCSQIGE